MGFISFLMIGIDSSALHDYIIYTYICKDMENGIDISTAKSSPHGCCLPDVAAGCHEQHRFEGNHQESRVRPIGSGGLSKEKTLQIPCFFLRNPNFKFHVFFFFVWIIQFSFW